MPVADPRIVFVGAVLEGRRCLEALIQAREHPVGIVTLDPSLGPSTSGLVPFDDLALSLGIPLLTVRDLNAAENVDRVASLQPDLIIAIGWTRLLGPGLLRLPSLGAVGCHASLLPRYRGRAPVNWAIINGERETGNTLFFLDAGVDSGDVIDQRRILINDADDCATVYEKVASAGVDMLLEHLPALKLGRAPRTPQDSRLATTMPRRRPEDGEIDWARDSRAVSNWVRALTHPYPGAFSHLAGRRLFVWRTSSGAAATDAPPGRVLDSGNGSIDVATANGTLRLSSVQWDGDDESDPSILRPLIGQTFDRLRAT